VASVGEVDLAVVPELSQFGALLTAGVSKALGPVESLISSQLGLAVGGAFAVFSVAQATQFESSMNRLIGLVGLSQKEVDSLSNSVLNLGGVLPQSPKELADALFFIESAGQRGAVALDTLKVSAEASAAGLGDTKTVADAVTSAMNSYAQEGLTAAHATDIMIAAVREGKLAPELFASSLGQVLPVASQLGITFDQVAAAIASSTREGLSAARAATGTRFLISSFIKPTAASVSALNSVGKSVAGIQNEIANRGLLGTLQDLAQRFDLTTAAGKEMFAQVVGGTRGMAVAAILVGENGRAVQKIFNDVADSAGSLDTAWEAASQTFAVQIGKMKSSVEALAIRFGTALLPTLKDVLAIFTQILRPVIAVAGALAKMPGVVSAVTLAFAAWKGFQFAAFLVERIAVGLEALGATGAAEAMTNLSVAMGRTAEVSGETAGALEGVGGAAEVAAEGTATLAEAQAALAEELGIDIEELGITIDELYAYAGTAQGAIGPIGELTAANVGLAESERAVAVAGEEAAVGEEAAAGAAGSLAGVLAGLLIGFVAVKTEMAYFNNLSKQNAEATDNLTSSITQQGSTLQPLQASLGYTTDQFKTWLALQTYGVSTVSQATTAYGRYNAAIGTILQSTLSGVAQTRVPLIGFTSGLQTLGGAVNGLTIQAPKIESLWQVYGTGLLNSTNLTNQSKIEIAKQLTYLTALGGNLGHLGEKELTFAESTGEATNVLNIMDDKINQLAPSLNATQQALAQTGLSTSIGAQALNNYANEANVTAQTVGSSFQDLAAQAHQVFVSDGSKFGQNWDDFTKGIVDAYSKAQQALTTGIDQLANKMQTLFSQKTFSATDILHTFQSATQATITLGKNLTTIANIGNGKGRALSQWVASLGTEAPAVAAKIANAGVTTQKELAAAYNKNRDVVQSVSDQISTKILGTLQQMLKLLKAVASQEWNVTMNAKGNAKQTVDSLATRLAYLGSHPTTIEVNAVAKGYTNLTTPGAGTVTAPSSAAGGGAATKPPQNGPNYKPNGNSTGGIIHGATGFITRRPTYLVGEGSYPTKAFRGSEAVIPLNARGRKFVRDAWGMDGQQPGGPQKLVGELTLTKDSKAYIRAVIHEEVTGAMIDDKLSRRIAGRR
jgi:TP901 family phage tail tape measure protein